MLVSALVSWYKSLKLSRKVISLLYILILLLRLTLVSPNYIAIAGHHGCFDAWHLCIVCLLNKIQSQDIHLTQIPHSNPYSSIHLLNVSSTASNQR